MKFSKNAQAALTIAKKYATKFNSKNVGTEHLLIGLIESNDVILNDTFSKLNVSTNHINEVVISILSIDQINKTQKLSPAMDYTPRVVKIIEFSKGIAQKLNKNNVEIIHLFLSLLYENDGVAVSILSEYGLDFESVKSVIKKEFGQEIDEELSIDLPEAISPFLEDITENIKSGIITTKFVRDIDYNNMFLTLGKKHNTNIIITGDPGVGKKGIVYELARRIIKKQAPEEICNKKILEIKLKSLISGTKYRGDFEGRMDIIQSYLKKNPDIIVFINDISLITRIEGTSNIEEYFCELFDMDDINFIGICDSDNYKKYIERISYIVSNFEVINIKPTDYDETLYIVNNNIRAYEEFHNVKYKKEVLEYSINLSSRYLTDRSQPTSAINLLDECGAYVKIRNQNIDEQKIKNQRILEDLENQKIDLVKNYKFDAATKIKEKQQQYKISDNIQQKTSKVIKTVDNNILKQLIFKKTGIPVSDINGALPSLDQVRQRLIESYVSQSVAIECIMNHFKRVKTGLQDPSRPLASFLFLGPTGVGKTYLCELISQELFHNKSNFLKIDMSEFMDKHSVSKLIGSPPGYVGYGDRCILGDFVKEKPYSLVLLDEVEKAHPDVMNIFLQVLDKGDLTDGTGIKINFKNTILAFTSNIGSDTLDKSSIGFSSTTPSSTIDIENSLKSYFKPEFLNRLDEIVQFNHLTDSDIYNLVDILNKKFIDKLRNVHKIKFVLTEEARKYISEHGYSRKYGARFLRRFFEKHIECEVATILIDRDVKPKKITCKLEYNKLIIE
tara:strand:+ start:9175 stop:11535 length:2361 start_codon:yes stop_codon:yes gene_type:complete